MNSNLKRVLSIALMAAILAVNLVIPAMAANIITVSYTDLLNYGSLANRQGELYYDTTSGSLDSTSNNNRAYAPLDVWSTPASRASLNMKADEWVRFEVTADTAGYYSVDVNASVGAGPSAKFYVRTEKSILEIDLPKTANQNTFANATNLGYIYLEAGTNYVYVDNKSTSYVNFRTMTLTLDEFADATVAALVAPIASSNEIGDLTVVLNDGYNQADVSNATLTFPVNIPVDGKYKVSVMGITENNNTVSADFGGDAKTATVSRITKTTEVNGEEVVTTIYGYNDLGVFALTEGAYTLTLDGFTDYRLAWVKVEYVSPYVTAVESESFIDGATVARGTDNLTITFNDNMLDTAAATLSSDIPVEVTVDGANVIVSFLETLDYETEYTLTVTGLQGINDDAALEDRTYTFTTADETNTDGTATVEITDVTTSRENGTVTGVVKGSTGVGIKGREVKVYDSTSGEVAVGESGDNGVFAINFTITEANAGAYNYTVTSEYGATTTAVVSYVSLEEELRILDLFLSATTPEAVYDIFEDYGEVLLIPTYAADCGTLADSDLFLGHFERKDFTAVSEVAPFYNKMLKLEGMNQATRGTDVDDYLTEEICNLLGIGSDKMDLIIKNDPNNTKKSSFATKIAQDTFDHGASTSEEAFVARIARLLDEWLLATNQITSTTLDLTNAITSAYFGGEISIPVDFQSAQKKVKTIKVVVSTADDNMLTDAALVLENDVKDIADSNTVEIDRDANTATFTVDFAYDETNAFDKVGKVALKGYVINTHTITVSATVIYRLTAGTSFADLPISVAGGSISATVNPTLAETVRPSTGGGGGFVAPPKEKVEEEEDNKAPKYFFDDMGSAVWAQDMVHALVGKGVISSNSQRAFRPNDNISREEYVKMVITAIGSHNPALVSNLSDVDASHWASSYIATAQNLGIVQGSNNQFGLGEQITRQDMAVIIYRVFTMLGTDLKAGTQEFADNAAIASYAKDAVSALANVGIINGMGDNTFAPTANATRAQAAKMIYVMMEVLDI